MKDINNVMNLLNNNKQLFLRILGKQDFVFTYEFMSYTWGLKFPNGILALYTGNKGTGFEYKGNPDERDVQDFEYLLNFIIKQNELEQKFKL
jgi:hypothetical protein